MVICLPVCGRIGDQGGRDAGDTGQWFAQMPACAASWNGWQAQSAAIVLERVKHQPLGEADGAIGHRRQPVAMPGMPHHRAGHLPGRAEGRLLRAEDVRNAICFGGDAGGRADAVAEHNVCAFGGHQAVGGDVVHIGHDHLVPLRKEFNRIGQRAALLSLGIPFVEGESRRHCGRHAMGCNRCSVFARGHKRDFGAACHQGARCGDVGHHIAQAAEGLD